MIILPRTYATVPLYPQEISFAPVKARYVEIIINSSKLPKWHGGAGSPAFLFVDEIEILY